MALSAGDRLGPYEIVSLLGAGGMGEVYRARDTRLDRTVAVKILSSHIDSPVARERFEREARAVSSLNHPHICALYDVGSQQGCDYLVMEYLPGETLAARLAHGPLPLDKVLEYAIQIAGALDRAHRQGVVHRDLKPGNVILTRSGAKLLDFGLAKIGARQDSLLGSGEATRSLTAQSGLLGTCQYMAPELLEGKEPDARCDIFSFGAVLYEMITGRRAFSGATQPLIIADILEHEPPPLASALEGASSPLLPELERLVRSCLLKDPEERRQSAHDIVLELRWIQERGSPPERKAPLLSRRDWRWVSLLVILLPLAFLVAVYRSPHPETGLLRLSVLPPEKTSFAASSLPALSPDGRLLLFVATGEDKTPRLWLRSLDSLSARPLAGTEGASNPFWSPDSQFVGFFAHAKLRRIRLAGGPPLDLCDTLQSRGGSWSPNGTIVFTPTTEDAIYRVPAGGGAPVRVTELDAAREEVSHRWPWFLPDGRHFLYTGRSTDAAKTAIFVADLDSGKTRFLLAAGSNAVYAAPGFLLFVRERTLMAVPFDARRLRVTGEPFPIAEPVDLIVGNAQGSFAASQSGTIAYFSGGGGLNSQLAWFDRTGKKVGALGEPGNFVQPVISPDGAALAVDRLDPRSGVYDIWQYDLARGAGSRLTFSHKHDSYPVWSPDGRHIAFSSNRDGQYNLYRVSIDSAGKDELLLQSPVPKFTSDWSRDGRYLVYYQIDPRTKYDIWVLPDPGAPGSKPFRYLATEFNEHRARLSPDARWLAYTSDETGKDEVYVQSFPAPGNKWKVSVDGGTRPVWSRNGREIFYINLERKLMAADVKAGARFETGPPKPLFETHMSITRFFDVTPDGRRFLLIEPVDDTATPPMTVVVNWTAAIRH